MTVYHLSSLPFINKSWNKYHKDVSENKLGLLNIMLCRLNFNTFHKTLPDIFFETSGFFSAISSHVCYFIGLFVECAGFFPFAPSENLSTLLSCSVPWEDNLYGLHQGFSTSALATF